MVSPPPLFALLLDQGIRAVREFAASFDTFLAATITVLVFGGVIGLLGWLIRTGKLRTSTTAESGISQRS